MVRGAKAWNKIAHCMYKIANYDKIVKRVSPIEPWRRLFHIFNMRHNESERVNMSQSNRSKVDTLSPERHPRGTRGDSTVYPVISRRARGLSLGVNLFPERKVCDYDCPYCEVKPFSNPDARLADGDIERELRHFFAERWLLYKKVYTLQDISISGNGEPTLSPRLGEALRAAKRVLIDESSRDASLSTVPTVLITNSSGFLRPEIVNLLGEFGEECAFKIWAKLDGGTEELHRALSRSAFSLAEIVNGITEMSRRIPLTLQTMLVADTRTGRMLFDATAYASLVGSILADGGQIEAIQLYTVARRPLESWVAALSDVAMAEQSHIVHAALALEGTSAAKIRIECYGERGELVWR